MKKFLLAIVIWFGVVSPIMAAEEWIIDSFHADINIDEDAKVQIVETIEVDFFDIKKHGIYRTIPVKYKTKYGNNLDIRFELIDVTDQQGKKLKYSEIIDGGDIKVRIGHPNIFVSNKQVYLISYTLDGAITTPTENAEFYWNVTGDKWEVPINKVTANIRAPNGAIKDDICFTGITGSTQKNCTKKATGNIAEFSTNRLSPGEGLTVALSLDDKIVVPPSEIQKFWWFVTDNWILVTPLVTLMFMLRLYWIKGRDKQYGNIFNETNPEIVPFFQRVNPTMTFGPPENLSPGEVGVLVDEKVNMRDITAVMIDLARRGFYKIHEIKKKGTFSKSSEFELKLSNKREGKLLDFEKDVMTMLFGVERKRSVKLHKLPKGSYLHLEKSIKHLYQHMTNEKYFSGVPTKIKNTYKGIGGFIMFLSMFLTPLFIKFFNPIVTGVVVFLSGLIVMLFAPFMPARTAKGRKALQEVVGLKEWIRIGAWREKIHEKNLFLEEVLPFTIAFGMTKKFIKAFKDADLKSLDWYQSSQAINAGTFSSAMNSFQKSANSGITHSMPVATRSSSSSNWGSWSSTSASRGSSGFSSSGGSSGGGFGGGGGGSW